MHECNSECEQIDDRAYRTTPRLKILLSSSSVRARASPERNMNFSQTDGRTGGRIGFKKKKKKKTRSFFEPIRTDSSKVAFLSDPSGREKNGRQRAALRCTTIVVVCRLSKSAIVSVYPWPVFAHWAVTVAGSAAPIGSLAAFPNGGGETITRLDVVLKPEFRLGETARGRAE